MQILYRWKLRLKLAYYLWAEHDMRTAKPLHEKRAFVELKVQKLRAELRRIA